MTAGRPVASRLIVGLAGCELHPAEAVWLSTWSPAGVILFGRNCRGPRQLAALCATVREHLPPRGEIVSDHEGGAISVLTAAAGRPPAPWSLGKVDDPGLTRRVHAETARRLRSLGVDRALAPCCDVLTEARNPVIGARAFGTDPDRVARHVRAAVRGLRDGGVGVCLKHWPGHGGTAVDTHDRGVEAGAGIHEAPFSAGFAAGADALMVGHLHLPGRADPVTLDTAALSELTRRCGPGVQLVSDDVTMGGLREAMARRGICVDEGHGRGLIDPASLPLEWFETLLDAGLARLLVRGIPWRALPVTGGETGPTIPPRERLDPRAGEDLAPDESYEETRHRAFAGATFADPAACLLWLDTSGGDSWGEAARLEDRLAGRFQAMVRIEPGDFPPRMPPCDRLLVTSHRPLAGAPIAPLVDLLSGAGSALVMGHPSLQEAVQGLLGPDWRVDALFDFHAHDLASVL